jgi:hypothetical protein
LTQPIGNVHVITIRGAISGKAELTLNSNSASISEYGDVQVITAKLCPAGSIGMERVELDPAWDQERRLYRLTGSRIQEGHTYYLVVPKDPGGIYRLVADIRGQSRRAVTLEIVPDSK